MQKIFLENLDCAHCASKLETHLKTVDGVKSATIHFPTLTLHIETSDLERVKQAILKHEPGIIFRPLAERATTPEFPWKSLAGIAALAGVYFALLIFQEPIVSLGWGMGVNFAFIALYVLAGAPVLIAAVRNILKGDLFDENFLMSLATITALLLGIIPEAAGVMLFYKTGEFLQALALGKSRKSIESLLSLRPDTVRIFKNGEWQIAPPESAQVGELFKVLPGEKIPLDGQIIQGSSQADTSALTGESVPRALTIEDQALAGMVNGSGVLTLRVTRLFTQSSLHKIMELVETASQRKANLERFFTSFAKVYTPIVLILAVLIAVIPPLTIAGALWNDWIYRALVILMISCPCALVISIPLAYFGGLGAASRRGILLKGSQFLDILPQVTTLVFDKTGTLTKGRFEVLSLHPSTGVSLQHLCSILKTMEEHSNHPIAKAIVNSPLMTGSPLTCTDIKELSGWGIEGLVSAPHPLLAQVGSRALMTSLGIEVPLTPTTDTEVHVLLGGQYLGSVILGDEIKPEALQAIAQLRKSGVKKIIMLTGDHEKTAQKISAQLGLDAYYSQLLPEDKYQRLQEIQAQNPGKTAFVGDGINDAPVLAAADVGIAMGRLGADAALESADVVLMQDRLTAIPESFSIARRTRTILWQNIVFALTVKGVFIILGALGVANMWEAVFGDVGVTLLAVLNSARALRIKD